MRQWITVTVFALTLVGVVVGQQGQDSRGGQMPPNHPPMGESSKQQEINVNPDDVQTVDAIISAYYDIISGPGGEQRDWPRFRGLFHPEARFITNRPIGEQAASVVMKPEQYIQFNQTYFEKSGYFETELKRRVDEFGNIAHVFSTYASRRQKDDAEPYSRGINSIQLMNDGKRWFIVTVLWDFERPKTNPIPARYLPDADASGS